MRIVSHLAKAMLAASSLTPLSSQGYAQSQPNIRWLPDTAEVLLDVLSDNSFSCWVTPSIGIQHMGCSASKIACASDETGVNLVCLGEDARVPGLVQLSMTSGQTVRLYRAMADAAQQLGILPIYADGSYIYAVHDVSVSRTEVDATGEVTLTGSALMVQ